MAFTMKKAVIAMSGGVDSSVAALLTVKSGVKAEGITLKLYDSRRLTCGSGADAADAKAVADSLGIPHKTLDYADCFLENVADPFVQAYAHGETPNPCIFCNRAVKFGRLTDEAAANGFDGVVTGHYAKIEKSGGRYLLKKAADAKKDQSYFLYTLNQYQLAHAAFPLGGLTKDEVRAIADEHGFVNAHKSDSQDICFIPDGDYASFIEGYLGREFPSGDFVDTEGRILGRHRGIIRYTIGKRRGLGLSLPEPLYVQRLDMQNNRVILCRDSELFTDTLTAKSINLIAADRLDGAIRVEAKLRSAHKPQPATVIQTGADELKVTFDEPQRAVTAGQSVVLYDGDTVVGGGIIA